MTVPDAQAVAIAVGREGAAPVVSRIPTAFWTLSEQAIVSIGSFATNVALARQLAVADYGTFGLLFAGTLMLQMVLASLVFHPLSIRRSIADREGRQRLAWASLAICGLVCMPLAAILAAALAIAGRLDLAPPAIALFLCWQLQETLRRNLLSELRFRAAIVGGAVAYLGQAALAIGLGAFGALTLESMLWSASGVYLIAAAIQLSQLALPFGKPLMLGPLIRDFWAAGSWSLLSNGVSIVRLQSASWMLAALHGPGAVAAIQASLNIVNLTNPLVTALCNVIPQTVARENRHGPARAWHAARSYALLVAPLVATTFGLTLVAPDFFLRVIYGAGSPYLGFGTEVRILVIAASLAFVTETICAFFHGIDRARAAFITNAAGAIACLLLLPLVWSYAVTGACLANAATQAVRLAVARFLLQRAVAGDEAPTD